MRKLNLQKLVKEEFIKLLSEDSSLSLIRRDNPANPAYDLGQGEDYTNLPIGLDVDKRKGSTALDVSKDVINTIKDFGVGVSVAGKGWHGKVPKTKRVGPAIKTGISYTGKFDESQTYLKQVIEEELEAMLNEHTSD